MMRDKKGRFVKGHKPLFVDYSEKSKWYSNIKGNFFKKENNIRNTGKTRFKKGQISTMQGRKHTLESRKKMSESHKGGTFNKETVRKRIETRKRNGWFKNLQKTKEKIRNSQMGNKGNNWRGGVTSINRKYRKKLEWKIWRERIFIRDDYECQICKTSNKKWLGKTVILHPHHIIPLSKCILLNRLDLIFKIDNGITLCKNCHQELHRRKNHGVV